MAEEGGDAPIRQPAQGMDRCDEVRRRCDTLLSSVEDPEHDAAIADAERALRFEPKNGERSKAVAAAFQEKVERMLAQLREAADCWGAVDEVADEAIVDLNTAAATADAVMAKTRDRKEREVELVAEGSREEELRANSHSAAVRLDSAERELRSAKKAAAAYEDQGDIVYDAVTMGKLYLDIIDERDAITAELEAERVWYEHYTSALRGYDIARADDADLAGKRAKVDEWLSSRSAELRQRVNDILEQQHALSWPGYDVGVADCASLLDFVDKQARQWQQKCRVEAKRRVDKASAVDRFMQDDAKLLQWCRQERTNLEALQEPGHQQEFCASLLQNFVTMEENFAHLCNHGTPLLPSRDVECALVELSEVWLYLQMFAYELMQRLMYEIHPTAKLEDEVRVYSTFTDRLGSFLRTFLDVDTGSDGDSLLRRCETLQRTLRSSHHELSAQLMKFSERMTGMRCNYMAFRQHVLGKLTFISDPDVNPEERAEVRQKEYEQKRQEIQGWGTRTEKTQSWSEVRGKAQDLKKLLQEQMAALREKKAAAPPPPAPPEDVQDY